MIRHAKHTNSIYIYLCQINRLAVKGKVMHHSPENRQPTGGDEGNYAPKRSTQYTWNLDTDLRGLTRFSLFTTKGTKEHEAKQ